RLGGAVDEAAGREARDDRDRGVGAAGELEEEALGLAVLGHEADGDVGADGGGGGAEADRAAVDEDAAGAELGHAEAGEEEVLLAHALQAGDAEDLAPMQVEADAGELR